MISKFYYQKGFIAFFISILVLAIMLGIALSITVVTVGIQRISANILNSTQAYYTAEAGVEDALLRLSKAPSSAPSSYTINIAGGAVTVNVSDVVGGSRVITAEGNNLNRIKKVQAVYTITAEEISFYFGVQVGDLGLEMDGNAEVHGNIFSNGSIIGASNTKIYGNVISAGSNGIIESIKVISSEGGGDVWVKHCQDSDIDGDLHYTSKINCTATNYYYHEPGDHVEPEDMPISAETINKWKTEAVAGGTILDYSLGGNNTDSLGPVKVDGNMVVSSNEILTVTGTIWVTGNLTLSSNVILQLSPDYGSYSGVIVVDGQISVDSNVTFCGSEGYKKVGKCNPSVGSYLMLLSTRSSVDPANPAILATSNTKTAILYASAGFIRLSSNADLKEATGYGIYMDSNAEVTYETGLADIKFTSGPGGSWQVENWNEIE